MSCEVPTAEQSLEEKGNIGIATGHILELIRNGEQHICAIKRDSCSVLRPYAVAHAHGWRS